MEIQKLPYRPTLKVKRQHALTAMKKIWEQHRAQLLELKLNRQAAKMRGAIDSANTILMRLGDSE